MQSEEETWNVQAPRECIAKMIRKVLKDRPIPPDYTSSAWFANVDYAIDMALKALCESRFGHNAYLNCLGHEHFTLGFVQKQIYFRILDLYREERRWNAQDNGITSLSTYSCDDTLHREVAERRAETNSRDEYLSILCDADDHLSEPNHSDAKEWQRLLDYAKRKVRQEDWGKTDWKSECTQDGIARALSVGRATIQRLIYRLRAFVSTDCSDASNKGGGQSAGYRQQCRSWRQGNTVAGRASGVHVRKRLIDRSQQAAKFAPGVSCTSMREAVCCLLTSPLTKSSPGTIVRVRDVICLIYKRWPRIEGDPRTVRELLQRAAASGCMKLEMAIGYVDALGADCIGNLLIPGCGSWAYLEADRELIVDECGWLVPSDCTVAMTSRKVA